MVPIVGASNTTAVEIGVAFVDFANEVSNLAVTYIAIAEYAIKYPLDPINRSKTRKIIKMYAALILLGTAFVFMVSLLVRNGNC